jgi:hypothetical protein
LPPYRCEVPSDAGTYVATASLGALSREELPREELFGVADKDGLHRIVARENQLNAEEALDALLVAVLWEHPGSTEAEVGSWLGMEASDALAEAWMSGLVIERQKKWYVTEDTTAPAAIEGDPDYEPLSEENAGAGPGAGAGAG